ncbi:MAG: rhomboid family intramembrane serine protease [Kiritimatiellaeota bacterium]|nr:rhomboid family intramembrane serine protease [Kiritimatiellota bacterium]
MTHAPDSARIESASDLIEAGLAMIDPETGDATIAPPDPKRALRWLATLGAAAIPYGIEESAWGSWVVRVPADHAEQALGEIAAYEQVNRNWPPAPQSAASTLDGLEASGDILPSLAVSLGLVGFFLMTGPFDPRVSACAAGAGDSAKVIAGEWWRAATALTLHADVPHVLGNAVCCLFFGHALCRRFGFGLAWAMIFLVGVAGNLLAEHLGAPGQVSIGASTAVFGALGMLAAAQFVRNFRLYGNLKSVWARAWVAAFAGVALLSLLGTGPRADLRAHFYGFAVGVGAGAVPALWLRRPPPEAVQIFLYVGMWGTVLAAWMRALADLPPR